MSHSLCIYMCVRVFYCVCIVAGSIVAGCIRSCRKHSCRMHSCRMHSCRICSGCSLALLCLLLRPSSWVYALPLPSLFVVLSSLFILFAYTKPPPHSTPTSDSSQWFRVQSVRRPRRPPSSVDRRHSSSIRVVVSLSPRTVTHSSNSRTARIVVIIGIITPHSSIRLQLLRS